jgi:hypothetical protein
MKSFMEFYDILEQDEAIHRAALAMAEAGITNPMQFIYEYADMMLENDQPAAPVAANPEMPQQPGMLQQGWNAIKGFAGRAGNYFSGWTNPMTGKTFAGGTPPTWGEIGDQARAGFAAARAGGQSAAQTPPADPATGQPAVAPGGQPAAQPAAPAQDPYTAAKSALTALATAMKGNPNVSGQINMMLQNLGRKDMAKRIGAALTPQSAAPAVA